MIRALSHLLPHAIIVGLALAALIEFEAALAVKVLLASGAGLLILILLQLISVEQAQSRIYTTSRLIFIALETERLDSSDKETAVNKLSRDIEKERQNDQITTSLSGHTSTAAIVWILYGLMVALIAAIAVASWPVAAT